LHTPSQQRFAAAGAQQGGRRGEEREGGFGRCSQPCLPTQIKRPPAGREGVRTPNSTVPSSSSFAPHYCAAERERERERERGPPLRRRGAPTVDRPRIDPDPGNPPSVLLRDCASLSLSPAPSRRSYGVALPPVPNRLIPGFAPQDCRFRLLGSSLGWIRCSRFWRCSAGGDLCWLVAAREWLLSGTFSSV
jgi:hypothetical protein